MVSKTEYEKNQKAFLIHPGAAQSAGISSGEKFIPGLTEAQRAAIPIAAGAGIAGGGALAGIIGGGAAAGGGGAAVGGQAAGAGAGAGTGALSSGLQQAGALTTKKLMAILFGQSFLNSAIAGFMSGPNTAIGQEFNTFWASQGVDVGQLRLMPFEQMFTTPVEDPVTGEWTFLFNDEAQIRKRMSQAGIVDTPKEPLQSNRITQLRQIRAANFELIQSVGPISELPLQPGELPFTGAQRIAREKIQATEKAAAGREQAIAESQKFQQQATAQGQEFARQTGLPANEAELRQQAAQGNVTAEELLALLRAEPPEPTGLSPPSGSQLTPEQLALAKKKEGERRQMVEKQPQAGVSPVREITSAQADALAQVRKPTREAL